MPEISQKMQQRAFVVSMLDKYRNEENINNKELSKDIEAIKQFENKELACKIILKEIKTTKSAYANTCAIILLEAIDSDVLEKEAINYLKDKTISDDCKFFVISLIKQKGIPFDYEDIQEYINNPEEAASGGVKEFLQDAIIDLEAQIDLLDFYTNISKEEKGYFLKNIASEVDGDDLANAFTILTALDLNQNELDIILDNLLNSVSPIAIEGLENSLRIHNHNLKTTNKINQKIADLKNKFPKFKNTTLIDDSKIIDCCMGFVDGFSNFSMFLSREFKNKKNSALMLTINLNTGITSCMGFSQINRQNLDEIIKRLYTDALPIKIEPVVFKALYEHYINKNMENNAKIPYEIIVWQKLLNDIEELNEDLSEYLNKNLKAIKLTESKAKKLATSTILETWYYTYNQNKDVDEIIQKIETAKTTDLDKINSIVSQEIDKKFINNERFMKEMQNKLLLQAFASYNAKLNMTSSFAYSMCFNNPYQKLLITSIIDKSLYYYLSNRLAECENNEINKRFAKYKIQTNFNKEELELIMAQLEEKWS